MNDFPLILTIACALIFDFINGFHDAANSIATVVSTRVLRPLSAVAWAAFFNLIAMFIFGPRVAETVSTIIKVDPGNAAYVWILFAALIGGIVWDVLTWLLGLPTSSSHALIGGMAGAALAFGGLSILHLKPIFIIILFIFFSPLIGFVLGAIFIIALYWIHRKMRPYQVDRRFRHLQMASAALYSIGHGANDAQKTMGIILAVMIAGGLLSKETQLSLYHPDTLWIILSCNIAMALGTFFGGWRIVRTMGMKITKIRPIGGFAAESAGALTLFLATLFGVPVSTTHTITGAIVGVGSSVSSPSKVKWQVATRIVWAWILTMPGAALCAALIFFLLKTLLSL